MVVVMEGLGSIVAARLKSLTVVQVGLESLIVMINRSCLSCVISFVSVLVHLVTATRGPGPKGV